MEELLIRLLEQSVAFAVLGMAWKMAENRASQAVIEKDAIVDRYIRHFEDEHPTMTIEKAGDI